MYNQGLAIISVCALYVSAFLDDINAKFGNFSLLLLGILLVLSTFLIDVYELLIHKKGYVEKSAIEVKIMIFSCTEPMSIKWTEKK